MELIQVPRSVFTEALWSRPFSELRDMAQRGECGLSVLHVPSIERALMGNGKLQYQLRHQEKGKADTLEIVKCPDDVAYLREGVDFDKHPDRTFLYGQNW